MTRGTAWSDNELARLRLEGLDHLNRLQSGTATEREQAEFLAWRRSSAAHDEAFRAAVRLQRIVRTVAAQGSAFDRNANDEANDDSVVQLNPAAPRRIDRRYFLGGALAASIGGALVVGQSLDMLPPGSALRADFRTVAGERRVVQLADGNTVDLNTRTSIKLRRDIGLSAVELISGEAILTSGVHSAQRAALVAGNGISVGRIGRFSARRDGDEICITCLTGTVDVRWANETRSLLPLDQVRYDDASIGLVKRNVDPLVLTAWQSGTLIFRNMPMRDVIAEINRYRPGKIYLANAALGSRTLSGSYYVARLDDFFSQAEMGLGVKVRRLPGNIIILT